MALLLRGGQSIRTIAATLGRSASTISRERRRNAKKKDGYNPAYAGEKAWARRWRGSRLARQPELRQSVLDRLAMGWSPEQVAGRLAQENGSTVISHESIYRFIYSEIRRTNDGSWRHFLPRRKSQRGWGRRKHRPMEHIKDRVSLDKRPAYIEKRCQPGHWEADLLHPRKSGAAVLVMVERATRYVFLAKLPSKHAKPVADQMKRWLSALPCQLRRTLTQDNGPEFFLHHLLHPLGIKTYFCDPHSPWQKGSVENLNSRIRRYIPLGTDPDTFSNHQLQALAFRLNHTPRKCLGFKTPAELLSNLLLHFNCESSSRPTAG